MTDEVKKRRHLWGPIERLVPADREIIVEVFEGRADAEQFAQRHGAERVLHFVELSDEECRQLGITVDGTE